MANYFEDFDFTDFWEDSGYAKEKYTEEAPSDELIASVEQELGYKLPASYIWLMKRHNGGIPVNTCFPTEEPTVGRRIMWPSPASWGSAGKRRTPFAAGWAAGS